MFFFLPAWPAQPPTLSVQHLPPTPLPPLLCLRPLLVGASERNDARASGRASRVFRGRGAARVTLSAPKVAQSVGPPQPAPRPASSPSLVPIGLPIAELLFCQSTHVPSAPRDSQVRRGKTQRKRERQECKGVESPLVLDDWPSPLLALAQPCCAFCVSHLLSFFCCFLLVFARVVLDGGRPLSPRFLHRSCLGFYPCFSSAPAPSVLLSSFCLFLFLRACLVVSDHPRRTSSCTRPRKETTVATAKKDSS